MKSVIINDEEVKFPNIISDKIIELITGKSEKEAEQQARTEEFVAKIKEISAQNRISVLTPETNSEAEPVVEQEGTE